jgi:alpha-tubulin suppressor-like RCC1 family protein
MKEAPAEAGPVLARRAPARRRLGLRAVLSRTALAAAVMVLAACSGTSGNSTTHGPAPGPTLYRWGVVGNKGKLAQLELETPIAGLTGKVVQIATSNSDGYALTSTGQVYGWGVNSDGELGDGQLTTYETKAVEVSFPAGVKITALANPMPFDSALAIDSDGHAWGWGLNGADDLCLSGLIQNRPKQLPLSDVTLATGARTHSLFDSNGTVYACGSGDAGELGTGSTTSASRPAPVIGLPRHVRVTSLASSWEGSGALLADDDYYYDWGYNAAGQLGNGTTADSAEPAKVDLPGPVSQVFQGGSGAENGQTVAILANGSVWTWGNNDRGQLGTGTLTSSDVPVQVHVPRGVTFVTVSSGGYASYAIDKTGRLWAWGDNSNGQLGTGSEHPSVTLPVDVGIHLSQVSSTAQNVAGLEQRC